MPLTIERVATGSLPPGIFAEVRDLCREAYSEDCSVYFRDIGPGVHLLGWEGTRLVSHLMWVERILYPEDTEPLRSAYIELLATRPAAQGRRYATELMLRLVGEIETFQLAALSPFAPRFYDRLGWESWRGPLFVRTPAGLEATPGEEVMVLRLQTTPVLDLTTQLSVDWRPGEVW